MTKKDDKREADAVAAPRPAPTPVPTPEPTPQPAGSKPSGGDAYLTPRDAAKRLHVSPNTIARWAKEGRIPCIVTLGGHRRFRARDIEAAAREMSARGEALSE